MKIKWKKGLFSSKYELFFQDQKVGELKEGIFSRTSIGKLNKSKLKFQKMGFFSSETEITDLVLNKSIGKIKFNIWGNKAELKVEDKKFGWKYDNFWSTRWSISENGQPIINYKSSTLSGEIESTLNNDLLLLTGLFVYNHYVRIMIAVAASVAVVATSN